MRVPVEDLDGAKFSKLCRDAKLLGKRFGAIDVDIVFAKVKVSSPHKDILKRDRERIKSETCQSGLDATAVPTAVPQC